MSRVTCVLVGLARLPRLLVGGADVDPGCAMRSSTAGEQPSRPLARVLHPWDACRCEAATREDFDAANGVRNAPHPCFQDKTKLVAQISSSREPLVARFTVRRKAVGNALPFPDHKLLWVSI